MNKKVALSILSATVVASMASSAFAAPKSGVYLGGDVDRYYELRDLFNLTDAGKTKFAADMKVTSFDKLIYVDFDGKGASLREIMNGEFSKVKRDLKETDFEGVYTKSNLDGSNGATYDPRKDAVPGPAGELKVDAVDALNAKEIVVDFDDELDTVTAEDESNYEVKVNNSVVTAFTTTVDSTDKTKAVIALTNPLKTGDYVSVTVKKTVLNKNLSGLEKDETKTFSFVDTAAPVVKSVQVKGNDVVVSFDEYVGSIGLITIDNKNVNVPSTTPAVKEITLTGAATGLTAGQHTIAFANVKDIQAPTPNNASYLTKTFEVTVDAAAPTVTKVEAAGEYRFKVVFDKEVSVPNAVSVKKNGYALISSLTPVDGAGTDDEYYVSVADNGQVKVYGDTETTTNLTVTVNGYKALNNNMFGNEFTSTVTLSKDGAAPTIVNRFSKVVNKAATGPANEVFQVQFSEELTTTVDATKIVLKDKDGVKKSITSANVVADANGKNTIVEVDANSVETAAGVIDAGTYTIDFGAGAVKDLGQNPNAAASVSIVKSGSAQGEIDLTSAISVANNVITINFGKDMAPAAAVASNYKLNGQEIKANAIYFDTNKQIVKIELQDETIASNGGALLSIADSVVAVDGSKLNVASKDIVVNGFTDNVDPTLVSAKKESSTSLVLTFSEDVVVANDAAHLDDFVVKVNGTVVAPTAIAGGTDKKVTLTLPEYNTTQTVTVATYKSDLNTKDGQGNTLKVNTTPITAN
ncbi:SwmB domain-containing protein [Brevibacillus sp. AG]|uniref:SwmB domain-containing protein n=1 Tax=Brevibacillus sp. AG TaxID=3020891 RepID=UPI000852D61A|nr:SwmB domain-containing protein [Brevibacillus sp. AG]MDC0761635.1 SwmB domain-containing protein [Brevibacillus sp. AG]